MPRFARHLFLIFVSVSSLSALAPSAASEKPRAHELRRVSLVYINDVHAQLEPHPELFWSSGRDEFVRDVGGVSRIATVFKRLRESRPGELLFIDGGDTIQGSGPAAWTQGKVVVEPMNALGLDLAVPGNWAVAYGAGPWKERANEFSHQVVAANMLDAATGELLFEPYVIKERNGVRIGLIGFTEPDIPTRQPPHMSEGLSFRGTEVLQPLVTELRERHRVDVVVVATHIGLSKATHLAETLVGVDVVLSADTHERTYEPIVRGDTWVVEAGVFGSFVGTLDLFVDGVGKVVDRAWRLIELRPELFPEDPDVKRVVEDALAPHRARMNRVIGYTDVWLARYEVLNTPLDNIVASAIRDATGADVALSNGFRFAPPTAPGPITEADLWNWLPVPLALKTGQATGAQLKEYWETELENVFSRDPQRLFGGWMPRSAGTTLNVAVQNPVGGRVGDLLIDGAPVQPQKTYTLAAGSRKGAPENSVHRVEGCQFIRHMSITTHDAVERYLRLHSPIRTSGLMRIRCTDCSGIIRSQTLDQLQKDIANDHH
ncbi:MAG TPA: bifunctional metallophosphatase/5'-nucleotidase [Hyphomicrobium sp.]|nr:bifunctional metallophosphatase/5'-nucleotidase [Hyphomicrobium sp.]